MRRRSSHPFPPGRAPAGNSTVSPDERQNHDLSPGLYVTATPIGNARDITLRALDVLTHCDLIAAEDTRVTARLLAIYRISKPLLPYNDHNAPQQRPVLLRRLREGARIALVSDAGTPLVSDPGLKLVREALAERLPVVAVPGVSAPLAALMTAGMPTDRFLFAGFLPAKHGERGRVLDRLADIPATLVFFESAQRLGNSLADMRDALGPRPTAVARELTKLHEEIRRGNLDSLATEFANEAPKGELTVIVGPPAAKEPDFSKAEALFSKSLPYMPLSQAVELVVEATGLPKSALYKRALALSANERD